MTPLRCTTPVFFAAVCVALASRPVSGGFVQSYQATGRLGLEVAAVDANPGLGQIDTLTGSFSLSQVKPAANIQKAFVYTNDWQGGTLSLTFNGMAGVAGGAFQNDMTSGFTLTGYRWDVTTLLIPAGPLSYSFSIQSSNMSSQIAGAALVVVWQDPTAPVSTVTIVDGAKQVGETIHNTPPTVDTETATFMGLPAGPTGMSLFTVSDDAVGTGETVRYNGGADHGPIDANLGFSSSLLQFNEMSQAGSNTLAISSGADHFGWLVSASMVTPIPEPSTLMLMACGGVCLAGGVSRRRQIRSRRTGGERDTSGARRVAVTTTALP